MPYRKQHRLVAQYERGVYSDRELATLLVEETTELPTDEFVATLPAPVVPMIRDYASAPPDTQWIRFRGCNPIDRETYEAHEQKRQQRWSIGLVYWREYFGFNAEQST